jgi:hypothetical protein
MIYEEKRKVSFGDCEAAGIWAEDRGSLAAAVYLHPPVVI